MNQLVLRAKFGRVENVVSLQKDGRWTKCVQKGSLELSSEMSIKEIRGYSSKILKFIFVISKMK